MCGKSHLTDKTVKPEPAEKTPIAFVFARIFVVAIKFWSRCGEREGDDDWMKVMSVDCTTHPNSVREMCVVYGAAVSSLSLKFSWALLVFWLNYIPSLSLFFFLSLSLSFHSHYDCCSHFWKNIKTAGFTVRSAGQHWHTVTAAAAAACEHFGFFLNYFLFLLFLFSAKQKMLFLVSWFLFNAID